MEDATVEIGKCLRLAMLLALGTGALAQAQPTPASPAKALAPSLSYSIVSIHPVNPGASYTGGVTAPDQTEFVLPLKGLAGLACGLRPEFVFGGPKWSDSELFDITAKVDESDLSVFEGLSYEQKSAMLRPILESRFGLKVHQEIRVLQVFDLVVAKGGLGPHFRPSSSASRAFRLGSLGGEFNGAGVEMPLFTRALSNELSATIGHPVLDKTGLTGKYNFTLKYGSPAKNQAITDSYPDIFTAMQEQLGLKLQPAREPVEVIVIDSAEQPSEH